MEIKEAIELQADTNKAASILDNMGNKYDIDALPPNVKIALEKAWRAAQLAQQLINNWIETLNP